MSLEGLSLADVTWVAFGGQPQPSGDIFFDVRDQNGNPSNVGAYVFVRDFINYGTFDPTALVQCAITGMDSAQSGTHGFPDESGVDSSGFVFDGQMKSFNVRVNAANAVVHFTVQILFWG